MYTSGHLPVDAAGKLLDRPPLARSGRTAGYKAAQLVGLNSWHRCGKDWAASTASAG